MGSYQVPRLRVILYPADILASERLGNLWYAGDDLRGHLELSNTQHFTIERISIYFEGVSRNWVAEGPGSGSSVLKGERKFLSQAHDILMSEVTQDDQNPGHEELKAPFHFVISRLVPSLEPGHPEQCLHLPPSLELGDLFIDKSTGKRFAQPSIAYSIRATVELNMRLDGNTMSLETTLPVIIMPLTKEFPPTETRDFPSEFRECDAKLLWGFSLRSPIGMLKFSMQEPPPLVFGRRSLSSSTTAIVQLELESTNSADAQKSLSGLNFNVCSFLRVKTFYSVISFPMLPGQSLLDDDSEVHLHDSLIEVGTWTVRDVLWGYRYDLPGGLATGTGDSAPADTSYSYQDFVDTSSEASNLLISNNSVPSGRWMSNWTIPIEIETRVLPTFCSSLAARLYSLKIWVKVPGIRQESFELEVPLQVIHSSGTRMPEGAQMQDACAEPQGSLEMSWLGIHLVREPVAVIGVSKLSGNQGVWRSAALLPVTISKHRCRRSLTV